MAKLQKTIKVNHWKQIFLNHLKNQLRVFYKWVCNKYYYVHFSPASVSYYVRLFQVGANKIENASDKILIDLQKKLYRDFKKKVPQTKIISTSQSGHFIQLDEPELVIGAIKEMLSQAN